MQLVGPDGKQRNYQEGTPLVDIAPDYQAAYDTPIALGVLNGREVPLQMIPQEGDRICFLDMNSVESYPYCCHEPSSSAGYAGSAEYVWQCTLLRHQE